MKLARLKPYNEKRGHVVRIYMIAGLRFDVDRGWYEVDDALAEELSKLTQNYDDPESPELFDVVTKEKAEQMEQAEADAEERAKATARRPASPSAGRPSRSSRTSDERGDLSSSDVATATTEPPAMLDPDPDGEELAESAPESERVVEVGRVSTRPGGAGGSASSRTRTRAK